MICSLNIEDLLAHDSYYSYYSILSRNLPFPIDLENSSTPTFTYTFVNSLSSMIMNGSG